MYQTIVRKKTFLDLNYQRAKYTEVTEIQRIDVAALFNSSVFLNFEQKIMLLYAAWRVRNNNEKEEEEFGFF